MNISGGSNLPAPSRSRGSKKLAVAAGLGAVVTAVALSVCSGVSSGVAQAGLNAPVPVTLQKSTPKLPFPPPEPSTGPFGERGLTDPVFDLIHNDDFGPRE